MKKFTFFILLCLLSGSAFAQWEIGIKITPSIASNRVVAPSEFGFKSLNPKTHFGGGIIADYMFGPNYAFSTGLIYNAKGAGVQYRFTNTANGTSQLTEGSDEFGIQYLEIPVTIKLYTNEIATDTRLFFQAGGSLDPRISAKVDNKRLNDVNNEKFTKNFNIADISGLFGIGAEKQVGESTRIFGGFSYHRGLVDIDNYYEDALKNAEVNGKKLDSKKIEIKNSYIALDLGLKF